MLTLFSATVGVPQVETENVQVEGNLETSYLLEQVRTIVPQTISASNGNNRSTLSVVLYDSFVPRTLTSRVKTFFARSKPSLRCQLPFRGCPRLRWSLQVSQTRTTPTRKAPLRPSPSTHSQRNPNFCTAKSSNTPPRRRLLILRREGPPRTVTRQPGCRRRRRLRTRSGSVGWRARNSTDG